MNDRWRRVGDLFDEALRAAPQTRDALIDASSEPSDVKNEVQALLAAHASAGDFLNPVTLTIGDDEGTHTEPAAGEELPQGTRLGPYTIERIIGRGGMGVVYAALDSRLNRIVALKALPRAAAADERQRRRLRQEARAAAALQHPGIATVYALEELGGDLFIASEYFEGETLREEMARGPMGPARASAIGVELLRALCTAHERGVVHRDLKPENVVRTRDGTLKILDFGVATMDSPARAVTSHSGATPYGLIAGTPLYMAPEHLLGRPSDFRVDHFALGVMLYELCTGRHPFGSERLPSTIARILADAPELPPASEVPANLWRVISQALEKNPAKRFATTRDFLDTLTARDNASMQGISSAIPASDNHSEAARRALEWWRFHQFATAFSAWALLWPVWHVHRAFGRGGILFFFAVLTATILSGILRLHLWFSSRVYPEDLPEQKRTVSQWIWWAEAALALLMIGGGIALPASQSGWAALLISYGVGVAVAFTFIEPATARAAFRDWYHP